MSEKPRLETLLRADEIEYLVRNLERTDIRTRCTFELGCGHLMMFHHYRSGCAVCPCEID